jgi:predicted acyltransferase
MEPTISKTERLMSLDALRGLDMFFLVCVSHLFITLPEWSGNTVFKWLAYQCTHPGWKGFTMYDIIFPMFIFIMGVAMPFSFSKRMELEGGKKKLFKHVVTRTITLMILGVILWQEPGGAHPEWGFYSVLYRIGISYFFASLVLMNTNIRGQAYWAFGLLIGYWMLIRLVPVPGHGLSDFSNEVNIGVWIENKISFFLSPDFRFIFNPSLMQAVANCLFGVLAGHWLLSKKSSTEKTIGLLLAGLTLIFLALLIHMDWPFYKKPGFPTFHFMTIGISTLLLSIFYWLIDAKGYKKWAFFLVVIGVNSITIYVVGFIVRFNAIANVFVGGFNFGSAQALMIALVAGTFKWLLMYYLYRQKVFLKI